MFKKIVLSKMTLFYNAYYNFQAYFTTNLLLLK